MRTILLAVVVLTACGGPIAPVEDGGGVDSGAVDSGAADAGKADAGMADAGSFDSGFDDTQAGLTAFVKSGAYLSWKAEPAIHTSAGPHGGNVRTFVNDSLYASLKANNAQHPEGSVVVKELYSSGTTITGYAVDVKAASGWVFYEGFLPAYSGYYYRGTANLCGNCHVGGKDYVLTPAASLP